MTPTPKQTATAERILKALANTTLVITTIGGEEYHSEFIASDIPTLEDDPNAICVIFEGDETLTLEEIHEAELLGENKFQTNGQTYELFQQTTTEVTI
jgi:hypothetical protein